MLVEKMRLRDTKKLSRVLQANPGEWDGPCDIKSE